MSSNNFEKFEIGDLVRVIKVTSGGDEYTEDITNAHAFKNVNEGIFKIEYIIDADRYIVICIGSNLNRYPYEGSTLTVHRSHVVKIDIKLTAKAIITIGNLIEI